MTLRRKKSCSSEIKKKVSEICSTEFRSYFRSWVRSVVLILGFTTLAFAQVFAQSEQPFNSPGSSTFTVPDGVTQITVQMWGAGGGGGSGNDGRGGGGGGGFAQAVIAVSPGQVINVTVGAGGGVGAAGGNTIFSTGSFSVQANGGGSTTGTAGGSGGGSNFTGSFVSTASFTGGNGGSGQTGGNRGGGGGGGSATASANGGNGGNGDNNSGGAGGTGEGNGGVGGRSSAAGAGQFPGGGGGGRGSQGGPSGNGANGRVVVSWSPPSVANSTIAANPQDEVLADGSDSSTITVTVRDENNNVMGADVDVFFEITAGTGGSLSSGPWSTNSSGQASAILTSTVTNTITITGYLGVSNAGDALGTATVEFKAPPTKILVETAADGTGNVVSTQSLAAGNSITAYSIARDADDNFVELITDATWSLQNITGGVVAGDLVDNEDGSATFTGGTVGSATIRAASGALSETQSGTITVTPGTADQLAITTQPVGGSSGSSLNTQPIVQIRDAQGNRVTGDNSTQVSVAIFSGSGGNLTGTTTVTAINGQATFTNLNLSGLVGEDYVFRFSSSPALTTADSDDVNVTFGSASQLSFSVEPSTTASGASITPAVEVRIEDDQGNLVSNSTSNVTIAIDNDPSSGATLSGTATVAAVNGVASFSDLSINLVGIGYTLGASSGALTGAESASFNITSAAVSASVSSVSVSPSSLSTGENSEITITVRDGSSNEINGLVEGDFNIDLTGDATVVGSSFTEVGNGVYTFDATNSTAEVVTVTVTVDSVVLDDTPSITFAASSVSASASDVSVNPASLTVGSNSTVTIEVRDSSTDLIGGLVEGDFVIDLTGDATVVPASFEETATAGIYEVDVTNNTAEVVTVTITADDIELNDKPTITFTPGAVSASASTVSVNPSSVSVGDNSTVTISVRDSNSNLIGGLVEGDFVIGLTGDAEVVATSFEETSTAGIYEVAVTNSTVETVTVTVTADTVELDDNPTITFSVGSATQLSFGVQPTNTVSGASISPAIQVRVEDGDGNLITSSSASVTLALENDPTDGEATLSGTLTVGAASGIATFSNISIDIADIGYTLQATSGSLNSATSSAFDISAGGVSEDETTISANPTSIAADGASTSTITVQAKDANGNNLTAGGDTVVLFTTSGSLGSVTDNADGTYTATLTSSASAGTATITGTINSEDITNTAIVTYFDTGANASQSTISANPTSINADGVSTSTITVQARDGGGNNLTSGGDTVALFTTAGSLGSVTDVGDGTYTAILTSSTSAERATITGQINSDAISDQATVDFTIGSALLTGVGGNTNVIDVSSTDYIVHVFSQTGTTTFTPPPGVDEVEVLVVGGGGGGGTSREFSNAGAGGGGAGGLVFDDTFSVSGDVTVTVGAGGAGGVGAGDTHEFGANGANSTFGSLVALGGGGGAGGNTQGSAGGSGGGSRGQDGGVANQPGSASGGFGNRGGNHAGSTGGAAATGGGGAGGAAQDLPNTAGQKGGNGGVGLQYDITGTSVYYAGGGGGGAAQSSNDGGDGGLGGGGTGGNSSVTPTAGQANTGGGGGGGNNDVSGADGGSGIVIVRYKAPVIEITQQPQTEAESDIMLNPQPEITILDGDGAPLQGIDVTVALASGTGTLNGTKVISTNASGVAAFTNLSISGDIGTYSLGFSVANNNNIVVSDFIELVINANADESTITAAPTSIEADGSSISTITVQVKNGAGVNLTEGGDTVVLSTNAGSLGSVTDNNDGTYTAELTSSTNVEVATVSGTLNGDPIGDTATVNFIIGAASSVESTISANPLQIDSDGSSTSTITVQLKDSNGNNITSGGDTVVITSSLGSVGSVTDNGNGTYTATLTSGTVAGNASVSGIINGNSMENSVSVAILPGPVNATNTTITASPTSIIASGSSTSQITVQAVDSNGNNLITGGATVVLSLDPDEGSLSGVTDNGNGTYTATLTSSMEPGIVTITGTINSVTIGDDATVEYLSGGEEGEVFIQGSGGEITKIEVNGDTYYVHQFNNTGTDSFTPPLSTTVVDFLIVGGGGGGGTSESFSNGGSGAGGAGGVLFAEDFDISSFTTPINLLIGGGGAPGAAGGNNSGSNGANSVFADGQSGSIVALGGGFGIGGNPQNDLQPAGDGGSGGGGRGVGTAGEVTSQTLPSGVIAYGNEGGETTNADTGAAGGGGGGAGTAGSNGQAGDANADPPIQGFGGDGGDGSQFDITGTLVYYGGGGGGGGAQTGTPGSGGLGGGGDGANDNTNATAGAANTGGGGGGGNNSRQGAVGGSGTIIIRYKAPSLAITQQPSATALSGQSISQQPELTLLNGAGNPINNIEVTVFLASGSGTLNGTLTATTNSSGVAQFTNLSIDGGEGFYTLAFNLPSASNFVISDAIEITGNSPFYSRQTGNWNVASNWSRDSHTGVAATTTPSAEDEIFIGGEDTITLNFSPFTLTDPGILTISDTGILAFTGENRITGTGTFVLESGGGLKIGSVNGITTSADAGNIRTSTRTYNDGANFTYHGSSAQETGDGLPEQLNDLEITNPTTVRASISHQVNGTLTLGNGALIMGDGLSLIANTKDITSGELQYELEISGQAGYRLLSSPLNVNFDNFLSEVITQGFTGASLTDTDPLQPNVLFYDETFEGTDNRRWRAPNNITDSVLPGRGYHVYMFGDVVGDSRYNDALPYTLIVNGQENEGTAGVVDLNVTYTEAGDEGWNLVGNPFGATIDWDDNASWTKTNIDPTIYVWDPNTNNYLTWNGAAGDITDGLIAPFQGFWIKANALNPELEVSRDAKTISAGAGFVGKTASKSNDEPVPVISLQMKHSQHLQSTAHVSFKSEGRLGMDAFDSFRLLPPPDIQNYIEFYSRVDDHRLSVNNLPRRFGRVIEVPLEMNAYHEDGALSEDMWLKVVGYQNIPDGWAMEIVNEQSGEKFAINLGDSLKVSMAHMAGKNVKRSNASGRVTAKGGDAHLRFTLRIAPGEDALGIAREFTFHPNYPNPFNPTTTLAFELPIPGAVRLEVYDLIGRRVAVLVNENLTAGSHSISWDASSLSSGVYLARLVTADGVYTRKLTLIK